MNHTVLSLLRNTSSILILLCSLVSPQKILSQEGGLSDKIQVLKDTLSAMSQRSENELFRESCQWFVQVIEAQESLTSSDYDILSATLDSFCIDRSWGNRRDFSSVLQREYPLIIAWTSPTDGKLSFAALRLPAYWDPSETYPLYIHLHGLASDTDKPIDFLCRYFLKTPNQSIAYDDGYLVFPWGRGNLWYQGISETDIWECKAAVEQLVKADPRRMYLLGHSMGGYGAWYIAAKSPRVWAALGVEAGALWYGQPATLSDGVIQELKDLPTCFVVGYQDGLFDVNHSAYTLLNDAGNQNTRFLTFNGGHEHLDANELLLYDWLRDFENEDYSYFPEGKQNNSERLECYPNPFREKTKLAFILDRPQHVKLSVYTIQGQLIETLVNKTLWPGYKEFIFSPGSEQAGLYVCRLELDGKQFVRKILFTAK